MTPSEILSNPQSVGPALVGAASAIGGGVWSAMISPDVVPVIGGIAIGVIGIGWSVYAAGRDRRVGVLTEEIEMLQRRLKEANTSLLDCEQHGREMVRENARLEAVVAGLKVRLDGDARA